MLKHLAKCFRCDTSIPDEFEAAPSSCFDRLHEERSGTGGAALRAVTHADILRYDELPRPVLVFANNPAAAGKSSTAHDSADQCQGSTGHRRAAPVYCNRAAARIFRGQTACDQRVGVAQEPDASRTQLLADLSSMEHPFLDLVSEALQRLEAGAEPDCAGDGAAAVTAALEALRQAKPLQVQLKHSTVSHVLGTDASPEGTAFPPPDVQRTRQSHHPPGLQVIEMEAIMYKRSLSSNSCVSELAAAAVEGNTSLPPREPEAAQSSRASRRDRRPLGCSAEAPCTVNTGALERRQQGKGQGNTGLVSSAVRDDGCCTSAGVVLCPAVLVIFDSTPRGSATVAGAACGDTGRTSVDAGAPAVGLATVPVTASNRCSQERVSIHGSVSARPATWRTLLAAAGQQHAVGIESLLPVARNTTPDLTGGKIGLLVAPSQAWESAQATDPSSSRSAAAASPITEAVARMADAGNGQQSPPPQEPPVNPDMQSTIASALTASRVPSMRALIRSASKAGVTLRKAMSASKVRSTSEIEAYFADTSATAPGRRGLGPTPLPDCDQRQPVNQDPHHEHHDLEQMAKAGDPSYHHHWLRLNMVLSAMEPIVTAFTSCGRAVFYQNEGSIGYFGVRPVAPVSRAGHAPAGPMAAAAPDMRAALAEGSGLAQLFALEPVKLGRMLADVSAAEGRVWKGIIEAPASCAPADEEAVESLAGAPANASNHLQPSAIPRDVLAMLCPTLAAAPDEGGDPLVNSVLLGTAGSMQDLFRAGASTTTVLDTADPLATSTWGLMMDNGEHTHNRSSMPRRYHSPLDQPQLDDGLVRGNDCSYGTGGGGGDDGDGLLLASTSDVTASLPSHASPGSSIPSRSFNRPQQAAGQRVRSYTLGSSTIRTHTAPRLPLSCQQQRQQQEQQQKQRQLAPGVGVGGGTPAPRVTSFSRGSTGSCSTASGAGSLLHMPGGFDMAKSAGAASPAAAAAGFESVTDTGVNTLDGGPYATSAKSSAVAGGPGCEGMFLMTRRATSTASIHLLTAASGALATAAAGAPAAELSSRSITIQSRTRPSGSRRRTSHVVAFASSLRNTPQVLQQAVAGGSSAGSTGPPGVLRATITTCSTALRSGGSGSPGSSAGARANLLMLGLSGGKATGSAGLTTRISSFTAGFATTAAATASGQATPSSARRLKSGAVLPTGTGPVEGIGSSHSTASFPGALLLASEELVRPALPFSRSMQTLPAIRDCSTDTSPDENFSFPATPAAPDDAGARATEESALVCGGQQPALGIDGAAGPAAVDDGVSSQQRGGNPAGGAPAGIVPLQTSRAASGVCLAGRQPKDLTDVQYPCFDGTGGSRESGLGGLAASDAAANVSGPQTRVLSSAKAAISIGSSVADAAASDYAGRVATPLPLSGVLRPSSPSIAAAAFGGQDTSPASKNAAAVSQTQLPIDASTTPHVAVQQAVSSLANARPLLDGPDAVLRQQQQQQQQQPPPPQQQQQQQPPQEQQQWPPQQQSAEVVWYEVTARRAVDPLTGGVGIVVTQTDVTAKVLAERHLALVAEAEHRLLEQIFPRHVLTHMAEEGGILRPPPPSGSHPGTAAAPKPMSVRDVSRMATTHPELTLLFADIQGFTPMCQMLEAHVVMSFLNDLFTRFDRRLDEFGVYKVETIGDCYFVVGGLIEEDEHGMPAVRARESRRDPLHAERVLMFAKAMLAAASEVRLPTTGEPVKIRIGIHSGPVVSGVVGERMPRFCLFGDTVNTTSRMESTGVPGAIHASEAARRLLPNESWVPTGGIEVKGKGRMHTYLWLPPDKDEAEMVRRLAGSVSGRGSRGRNRRGGDGRGGGGSSRSRDDAGEGSVAGQGTDGFPRTARAIFNRKTRLAIRSGSASRSGGRPRGAWAFAAASDSSTGSSAITKTDRRGCGGGDSGAAAAAAATGVSDDGTGGFRLIDGYGDCGTDAASSYTHGSVEHRSQECGDESVQGLALMLLGRKPN